MKNLSIFIFTLFLSISSVAQHWNETGNTGINPSSNFIGNTDDRDLRFRTDDDNRMVLTGDNGWLGLHTMSPLAPFTIFGGNVLWYNSRPVSTGGWNIEKVETLPIEDDGMRLMWVDSIGAFRARDTALGLCS